MDPYSNSDLLFHHAPTLPMLVQFTLKTPEKRSSASNNTFCSCLKMRKKKTKDIEVQGQPAPKKGLFGMFGKKQPEQQYNMQTVQPNGAYGQQQTGHV
jgi:hypothetical protein